MNGCQWCPLTPVEARWRIVEAAREGREHDLGEQCGRCQRTDWNLKSLNLALRQIEAERVRQLAGVAV
jgi:hypothetical protein